MDRNTSESLPRNPPSRPAGILVVDDTESVRDVLAAGLQHYGFKVWLASGGQEALHLYRSNFASIGMVLLDVLMPGRNGPQTLADLQRFDPDVRACFITGHSGEHSEASLLQTGAGAVFRKPVQFCNLAGRLVGLMANAVTDRPCGRREQESSDPNDFVPITFDSRA